MLYNIYQSINRIRDYMRFDSGEKHARSGLGR